MMLNLRWMDSQERQTDIQLDSKSKKVATYKVIQRKVYKKYKVDYDKVSKVNLS